MTFIVVVDLPANYLTRQTSGKKMAEIRSLMESLQEVRATFEKTLFCTLSSSLNFRIFPLCCVQVSGIRDVDELAAIFRRNEDVMFEIATKINADSKVRLSSMSKNAVSTIITCESQSSFCC